MEEQHSELEKTLRDVLQIEDQIREMEACDIAGGYSLTKGKIARRSRKRLIITLLSRVAAIAAIPLLISTFVFGYLAIHNRQAAHVTQVEIKSAPGLVTRFELPDKSNVWLNSGAVLRYPSVFADNKRVVELEGEGFFDVEADSQHPFYVHTGRGIRIMAHGTEFNVNVTDESIETVLSEGKVDILLREKSLLKLEPGDESVFDTGTNKLSKRKINVYEKTAWKDGKIIFRNAPLDEVFKRLSRRYNVDIVLHDERNMAAKYSTRITFTDETIQQIFTYLEVAAPIKWKLSTPQQNTDTTLTKQRIDVWLIN